jgi:integrase
MLQVVIDGRRRSVRLGSMSDRDARRVLRHVNELEVARKLGRAPEPATSAWLAKLPLQTLSKISTVDLVDMPKSRPGTVGEYSSQFRASRASDLKPSSKRAMNLSHQKIIDFFGKEARIDAISNTDARQFKTWMVESGLSEATSRKHIVNARSVFGAAIKDGIIGRNPFDGIKSAPVSADKSNYITEAVTEQLIKSLPSVHWGVLVALARYAGLRTPSETHALRWCDVDLESSKLRVFAPKAHRVGRSREQATRDVPITPALRRHLIELPTGRGEKPVVQLSTNNLHRTLISTMKRAGITKWSGLFQAMRRSCEVDFAQQHPQHVVSSWLGHSLAVSERHYLSVPASEFDRASGCARARALQNALQSDADLGELLTDSVKQSLNTLLDKYVDQSGPYRYIEGHGDATVARFTESPHQDRQTPKVWLLSRRAILAQLVEQRFCKPQVVGSSPTDGFLYSLVSINSAAPLRLACAPVADSSMTQGPNSRSMS